MSADEWTSGERLAAIVAQEINDAPAEELIKAAVDDVLRGWAARIREVGTAKGWSTWASAYINPDIEFGDTEMPSTETIVAELRRLDRVAILRQAAEAIEREQAREERAERERFGYLDHETELQGAAVRAKATFLRRLADDVERGKGTSVGIQPTAGGATPADVVELTRLRAFASATERRHDEIRARLAMVDIRDSAGAWDLGMGIVAILDGPLHPDGTVPPVPVGLLSRLYEVLTEVAKADAMPALKLVQVRRYLAEVVAAGLLKAPMGATAASAAPLDATTRDTAYDTDTEGTSQ